MDKNIIISPSEKSRKKHTAKVYHYFAGGNTGWGFDNLFDQINDPDCTGVLYILKGGPGTGKSTLMKTVGRTFLESGEDVEYFYCSSDYSSLDGVRLPKHNIAIVDGTAPHVTEAGMPGIRDIVINLGEYIGSDIKKHEKEIVRLLQKKKLFFEIAYTYIKNAANLYACNYSILESQKDRTNIPVVAKKIVDSLEIPKLANKNRKNAKIRKLYLDAVADDGHYTINNKNKYARIVRLSYNSLITDKILTAISELATKDGHDIICFGDILSKNSISAIYIPIIDTLIEKNKNSEHTNKYTFRFDEFNNKIIAELLREAAASLAAAKKQHKKVEAYYIANMDFLSISQRTESLIDEIGTLISTKKNFDN